MYDKIIYKYDVYRKKIIISWQNRILNTYVLHFTDSEWILVDDENTVINFVFKCTSSEHYSKYI